MVLGFLCGACYAEGFFLHPYHAEPCDRLWSQEPTSRSMRRRFGPRTGRGRGPKTRSACTLKTLDRSSTPLQYNSGWTIKQDSYMIVRSIAIRTDADCSLVRSSGSEGPKRLIRSTSQPCTLSSVGIMSSTYILVFSCLFIGYRMNCRMIHNMAIRKMVEKSIMFRNEKMEG